VVIVNVTKNNLVSPWDHQVGENCMLKAFGAEKMLKQIALFEVLHKAASKKDHLIFDVASAYAK